VILGVNYHEGLTDLLASNLDLPISQVAETTGVLGPGP
jgi:hypothetical protein